MVFYDGGWGGGGVWKGAYVLTLIFCAEAAPDGIGCCTLISCFMAQT